MSEVITFNKFKTQEAEHLKDLVIDKLCADNDKNWVDLKELATHIGLLVLIHFHNTDEMVLINGACDTIAISTPLLEEWIED